MSKKRRQDLSLLVGRNPVREALQEGGARIEKVMLQKGGERRVMDAIRGAASLAGVPVQYVPRARLQHIAGELNHQGVIAIIAPIAYLDVDDMLSSIAPNLDSVREKKPVLLVLDRIEDPHNLGAMLRTAVAAGVAGVIVPKQNMAPLNAAALKASAGLAVRIPIARVDKIAQLLMQLKERGYWVAGAAGEGDSSVWDMDWDRPMALVMGSEGKGLHPRVIEACDYSVMIPMPGPAESLNVSVAAGVLLFAAIRNRS